VTRNARHAIRHLLSHCGSLVAGERLLILCDRSTRDLADAFRSEAESSTDVVTLLELPLASHHGAEPPPAAAEAMIRSDLIVCLCRFSLAHSRARAESAARGARFLSLPLFSWDLLESRAVAFDFRSRAPVVRGLADAFTRGASARVTTEAGTDLRMDLRGRRGNSCPGFVEAPGDLGSPPDVEANVSPVEEGSEGVAVIDGSITCPEIGLLRGEVVLTVEGGRIRSVESRHPDYVAVLERMLEASESPRRVLAECGVGLNPAAELTGTMLTDEGADGCMHLGFGSNATVGGRNEAGFHLDFVFRGASLVVDGREVLRRGAVVTGPP
jgi:leucyl aminopeptidase (aminopeptidase T)